MSEISSAITKAHQILLIFPVKDKSHAEGKSAKICLINETHILKKPRPKAWKTEVNVIPIAANGKWIAIIRNAGIPISSISLFGENIARSCVGKTSKIKVPTPIIISATSAHDHLQDEFGIFKNDRQPLIGRRGGFELCHKPDGVLVQDAD